VSRLILRKLLLIALLLPVLNFVGFTYAAVYRRISYPGARVPPAPPRTYPDYLRQVAAGDLGSVGTATVREVIAAPVMNSLVLLLTALAIIVVLGPLLGILSISPQTGRVRGWALALSEFGQAVPPFFLGIVVLGALIYDAFRTPGRGPLLPLSGFGFDRHLILPVLVLAARPILQVARITATLSEHELQQEYVRVAHGKGLSWRAVYWDHVLPSIVSAVVIALGQSARLLIAGLMIVETLFLWPGLGRVLMAAAGIRTDGRTPVTLFGNPDLLAVLAVIFGLWLLLADFITAVVAHWLDPRLQE
jgi:peptide/nickel transport system permease protein